MKRSPFMLALARLGSKLHPLVRWADALLESDDAARREEAALKPGTKVRLACQCKSCDREKVWTVVKYNVEADDYRLACGDKDDYAQRSVLEVVAP